MVADYYEKTCRSIQQALDERQGGQAQFWSYSVSLSILVIRVVSHRQPGNLHLNCSPCLFISGPVFWQNCQLRIDTQLDALGETIFVLRDEGAHFHVTCRGIDVEENVEPIYGPLSAVGDRPCQAIS